MEFFSNLLSEMCIRDRTSDAGPQAGFGLYNVNQRIRLYYNNSGLDIQSAYRSGTTISFTIPCRMD